MQNPKQCAPFEDMFTTPIYFVAKLHFNYIVAVMNRQIYRFPNKLARIIIENEMLWAEKWRIFGEKYGFELEERGSEISILGIAAANNMECKKKLIYLFNDIHQPL